MAKETIVSNFKLKGREILSSYANFTLEGEITAKVTRGKEAWTITERNGIPKGTSDGENEAFYIPNIAFNMVCGGEHVPGTKQDIQEMFFFAMKAQSVKEVFEIGTKFFRQFEKNLVRDGLPTGTAKERGFVFPVADNFEGLTR